MLPNGSSHTSTGDQPCTLFLSEAEPASIMGKSVSHSHAPLPTEEQHRAPDTEENQIFIPAFGPIRDSGPIAEPSRVRREDLSNMSFN